jgi:A/G-specific adenine glycosylase
MAILRDANHPVSLAELEAAWPDPTRRARALDGLVADGLVEPKDNETFTLPGT